MTGSLARFRRFARTSSGWRYRFLRYARVDWVQRWLRGVSAPERLVIPAGVWQEAIRHMQDARPHEGVGLLAVKQTWWFGPLTAVRFYPGTNTLHATNRFAMDGREVLGALRDIREHGWTLGAIVHSHLAGPATPSPTDLREAHYPQALMLIVSFAGPAMDVRAWRIGMAEPREIRHEVPVLRWMAGGRVSP